MASSPVYRAHSELRVQVEVVWWETRRRPLCCARRRGGRHSQWRCKSATLLDRALQFSSLVDPLSCVHSKLVACRAAASTCPCVLTRATEREHQWLEHVRQMPSRRAASCVPYSISCAPPPGPSRIHHVRRRTPRPSSSARCSSSGTSLVATSTHLGRAGRPSASRHTYPSGGRALHTEQVGTAEDGRRSRLPYTVAAAMLCFSE